MLIVVDLMSQRPLNPIPCLQSPVSSHTYRVTANQLIDYVFTHDDSISDGTLFPFLERVQQHVAEGPVFESVQIAVNEGTTKPFVSAVLSELGIS